MMNFDFIGRSKLFFTISIALMAAILLFSLVFGINLDIQFKGGSIVTYSYQGDIDISAFEDTIGGVLGANASVQHSTSSDMDTMVVTMAGSIDSATLAELNDAVKAAFPQNNLESLSVNNVDAVIGKEFLAKSLTAVALASVFMMLYVAVRFRKIGGLSAGAMAVVALLHDVAVVFGVFVICRFPLNDSFIAVVLTILGYSLNDTIVIYDRVRENRRILGEKHDVGDLMNQSINQSFSRSLVTSAATLMATVVVTIIAWVYNVESILIFSFPMMIGLISGSYSTICIAGQLWVKWRVYRDTQPKRA